MAKSLLDFLSEVRTNGIRTTNMYEIEVSSGYSDVDSLLNNITMYGQGFSLPTRTQNFADVNFKGYPIPIPTNMEMEREHQITINADLAGNIRRAFLLWEGKVTDPAITDGSLFAGDKRPPANSYVRIRLLNADMSTDAEVYRLVGVSVQNVGNLNVSNTESNVATFDVTLKSAYWEVESTASSTGITK